MVNCSLAFLNGFEILLILLIVVIFFGAKRIPGLAKSLGQSIKEFKSSSKEPKTSDSESVQKTKKN